MKLISWMRRGSIRWVCLPSVWSMCVCGHRRPIASALPLPCPLPPRVSFRVMLRCVVSLPPLTPSSVGSFGGQMASAEQSAEQLTESGLDSPRLDARKVTKNRKTALPLYECRIPTYLPPSLDCCCCRLFVVVVGWSVETLRKWLHRNLQLQLQLAIAAYRHTHTGQKTKYAQGEERERRREERRGKSATQRASRRLHPTPHAPVGMRVAGGSPVRGREDRQPSQSGRWSRALTHVYLFVWCPVFCFLVPLCVLLVMAEGLARIYGTEEDKTNCPFYFKVNTQHDAHAKRERHTQMDHHSHPSLSLPLCAVCRSARVVTVIAARVSTIGRTSVRHSSYRTCTSSRHCTRRQDSRW